MAKRRIQGLKRLFAMAGSAPPLLTVRPCRLLVDEEFTVLVESLPAGRPFTVRSLHQSEDQDFWEGYGHYMSDHSGRISVSEDMSLGGTYSGKEPMALIWSMRPVPGSRTGLRLRKKDICTPMLVTVSVHSGHEDFRTLPPLGSVLLERWYMAPGVRREDVREGEVEGTLFTPPGPGPFPAVLDLWGGGGGLNEYRSALLASRGFASLALDYLKTGGSKPKDLELKLFETAFEILRRHPSVIPDRVGIIGLSLGTLVAVSLAIECPEVKPRCIVCISNVFIKSPGRNISDFGKSLQNKYTNMCTIVDNTLVWRDVGLALLKEPQLKMELGGIECPMLLVNGTDDQNWPSVENAEEIAKMMREAGKEYLVTKLAYQDAGHLLEPPYSPHFRETNFLPGGSKDKVMMLWGGRTKPHADAQEDSWRKILRFLQLHLYECPAHTSKL